MKHSNESLQQRLDEMSHGTTKALQLIDDMKVLLAIASQQIENYKSVLAEIAHGEAEVVIQDGVVTVKLLMPDSEVMKFSEHSVVH